MGRSARGDAATTRRAPHDRVVPRHADVSHDVRAMCGELGTGSNPPNPPPPPRRRGLSGRYILLPPRDSRGSRAGVRRAAGRAVLRSQRLRELERRRRMVSSVPRRSLLQFRTQPVRVLRPMERQPLRQLHVLRRSVPSISAYERPVRRLRVWHATHHGARQQWQQHVREWIRAWDVRANLRRGRVLRLQHV